MAGMADDEALRRVFGDTPCAVEGCTEQVASWSREILPTGEPVRFCRRHAENWEAGEGPDAEVPS